MEDKKVTIVKQCLKFQTMMFSIGITLIAGCKKPFTETSLAGISNYLVVEGNIDPGADSTIIKLSRTQPLAAFDSARSELHAAVAVEDDNHTSYPLVESGNGYYVSPGLHLNASSRYRITITTSENKTYQSDFSPVKNSPAIDSVYYKVQSNGVAIYADTHDAQNKTVYYRWQFAETAQIHSLYDSHYMHVKNPTDTVANRPEADQIYSCWVTSLSNNILINSTEKLSSDVISKNQIQFLPSSSEKIEDRYSILVKQYALTKEAFAYWQQLKNNTEQLGGIFDPLPSELPGNIRCLTVPGEPVIGFISVGSYTQKRIFIDTRDLPAWRTQRPYYDNCPIDSLYYVNPQNGDPEVRFFIYSDYDIPVNGFPDSKPFLGFTAARPRCVDCTLRGPNKPPLFWIPR